MSAPYPVTIRIREWKRGIGWVSRLAFVDDVISSLEVTFGPLRIERSATLEIRSRISTSLTALLAPTFTTRDRVLDNVYTNVLNLKGRLLRLDVFAHDVTAITDSLTFPTGWVDGMIYWSGVVQDVRFDDAQKAVRIEATGWTSFLDNITVRSRQYVNQTIRSILIDLADDPDEGWVAQWPGVLEDLYGIAQGNLSAFNFKIKDARFENMSARQVLEELGSLGNFVWGVSVCGYPLRTNEEFVLFFVEAETLRDEAVGSTSLGNGIRLQFDLGHHSVIEAEYVESDTLFANQWDFAGDIAHVDLLDECIAVDQALFPFFDQGSGWDPAVLRRLNPTGIRNWWLEFVDKARVKLDRKLPGSGTVLPAGGLEQHGQTFFDSDGALRRHRIRDYDDAASSILTSSLPPIPATMFGTDDYVFTRFRIVTDDEGIRLNVRVADRQNHVFREVITRDIDEPEVRGELQAGLFAYLDRYAQVVNSRSIRIRVRDFRFTPTGSLEVNRNAVGIQDGNQRVTLCGTSGSGGDGWVYGSDQRPSGWAMVFEIREARMVYTPSGWDASFQLEGAAVDLRAVIISSALRGKMRRNV